MSLLEMGRMERQMVPSSGLKIVTGSQSAGIAQLGDKNSSGKTGCLTPDAGGIHIAHVRTYILRSQPPPCSGRDGDRESPSVLPVFVRVLCVSVCVTCAAGNLLNSTVLTNVCGV